MGRGTSSLLEAAPTLGSRDGDGPDDHALVAGVRRGDDRAFESLYARYQRRIYAYVLGMCKDHARAEDITQEVFVSALRRMRETERPIAFKPWIYEIAKNACIDQFRRSRRAEEVSLQADDALAPADYGRLVGPGPTPEAAVVVKQDLDNLCGAFGGLSDVHHEILVMRELEGLSYREIGDRFGMSRAAVESTLFRARRRLGEEYDELVSGERCLRIAGIIATAAHGRLGARAARQLTRHVAHCQGCRREALEAGLDPATLRQPLRTRVAAKVAGLLPFPILRRGGPNADAGPGWVAHLASFSDQIGPGWSKAAAAAAVLLAGLGAGAGTKVVVESGHAKQPPAATATTSKPSSASSATRRVAAKPAVHGAAVAARFESAAAHTRTPEVASPRRGSKASTPSSNAAAPGGASSGPSATDTVKHAADKPRSVTAPASAPTPAAARPVVDKVKSVADATTDAAAGTTTQAVDTTSQAVDTTSQAVGTATQALPATVAPVTRAADSTTSGATAPVTDTVRGAARDVTGTVDGLTG